MNETQALDVMKALGVDCEIGSESYEAMLQHPTVRAYLDGDISISEAMFVEEYLGNGFNGEKAARAANYGAFTKGGFSSIGSSVLKRPKIKALVARRISERALRADEVLDRYREVADGSIESFINLEKFEVVDLVKGYNEGKLHLLKEIKIDKDGNVNVKMRDQDHALDQLARSLGVFEKDNTVNLPPEVLALLGLAPAELAARDSAYAAMEEWNDDPLADPVSGQPEIGELDPETE
jgi:phage terminase small subunit